MARIAEALAVSEMGSILALLMVRSTAGVASFSA